MENCWRGRACPFLGNTFRVFAVLHRRASSTPLAIAHVAFASRARMFVCSSSADARVCTCMHAVGLSCLAALFSAFFLVVWACLPPVSSVSFCPFLVLEVGVWCFFLSCLVFVHAFSPFVSFVYSVLFLVLCFSGCLRADCFMLCCVCALYVGI